MTVIDEDRFPTATECAEGMSCADIRGAVPLVWSVDIELSERLPRLGRRSAGPGSAGTAVSGVVDRGRSALVLVRLHGRPVGAVMVELPSGGLEADDLAARIWEECHEGIVFHLTADRYPVPDLLDAAGLRPPSQPPCVELRTRVLEHAPVATVIVATRERPDRLRGCLESLAGLDYPSFEIVVVDNAPETDATIRMIEECFPDMVGGRLRYVQEARRGLASAHNRGLEVAGGDMVAFTDDDVNVDREWLSSLAEGFTMADDVAAVTGLIHPAELCTQAQLLLENHGSFGKGFVPHVFDLADHRPDDPLFPLTAGQLGSGANMAFSAAALRRIGGFDPSMGTGTAARGGDDLVTLCSIVVAGYRLVYQPSALVFHHHRAEMAALGRQAYGYGVGLGAYLTNVVVHHPSLVRDVLRNTPSSLRSAAHNWAERNRERHEGWPAPMGRLERRGILIGPAAYLASCWHARHAHRPYVPS